MSIQGIGVRRSRNGSAAKERSAPKWELSGAAREQIVQYAREDAARGVYMGEGFLSLRRQEVAKAGPDRAALMARLGGTAAPGDPEIMEKIKEGDEMWLRLYEDMSYDPIVTLGTDAHSARFVGCAVRERQTLLKKCGFQEFCTFEGRRPVRHSL